MTNLFVIEAQFRQKVDIGVVTSKKKIGFISG